MSRAGGRAEGVDDIVAALAASPGPRTLACVDGGDGSGKTSFATRLADRLGAAGRTTVLIHVDDFLHVRQVRRRRGRTSAEGYLDDSYDYPALVASVLSPLSAGGDGRFRTGCVDRDRDVRSDRPWQQAGRETITIVEGLFLLRAELVPWWDFSVFLDVPAAAALARKARRDGVDLTPGSVLAQRYTEGQRLYRLRHRPEERATWILREGGTASSS